MNASNSIKDENTQLIGARIEAGLEMLRRHYTVEERPIDPVLANPVIGGRPHHARRFNIGGVGNLLVMTVTESEENQLSSFVITPYAKNLPLFSSDFVYSGDKRFFLLEIYDLAPRHDDAFNRGIDTLSELGKQWNDMPDFPTRPCWYDNLRPVCVAKTPNRSQDNLAIQRFLDFLEAFVQMEKEANTLSGTEIIEKWRLNKEYSNRLVDEGGVSTDLFVQAIGAENTRRFFDEVFFAPACYALGCEIDTDEASHDRRAMQAFFAQVDENGVSNATKADELHRTIRRVPTTPKTLSYESADACGAEPYTTGALPIGMVEVDGKLVGLGIHILNEDVYPLQSFEIYLRDCNLTGKLDLSGCRDMVFLDLYRNRIEEVVASDMPAMRILGLQSNCIRALDPTGMPACQGIDIGMNELREIDVSQNPELVELYVNGNRLATLDTSSNSKLKYLRCQDNLLTSLDVTANPLLRHLYATGNPLREIRAWAPVLDDVRDSGKRLPLELRAEEGGCVGLSFNPVYNAQWKETGEWEQSYHAYPDEGFMFEGWFDEAETLVCAEADWQDEYGASRCLTARFSRM